MNIQAAIDAARFVQFAATNWNSNGERTDLNGRKVVGPDKTSPVIAGKSFTVSRTIYANDLATDINGDRPAIEGMKTMGIVAVNDDNPGEIFVAIRGTLTVWEWMQDCRFLLRPFSKVDGGGLTEDGFTSMYDSFSFTPGSFLGTGAEKTFMDALIAMIPVVPGKAAVDAPATTPAIPKVPPSFPPGTDVTVTGHSLGAGLATLLALDLASHSLVPNTCITLASPRVGDLTFSHVFNHVVPNAYRVVNRLDLVPKVPPALMYWHVGDETELIPHAQSQLKFDIGCEHHLTTYTYLLAMGIGTASQYPLQANCLAGAPSLPGMPDPSAS